MSDSIQIHCNLPCEDCGSSRGKALYQKPDNTYWTLCYKCHESKNDLGQDEVTKLAGTVTNGNRKGAFNGYTPEMMSQGKHRNIDFRSISEFACKKYDVRTIADMKGKIHKVVFPYKNKEGKLVAQKVRDFRIDKKEKGHMFIERCEGHSFSEATFFGQDLWNPKKERYITIVEGEFDALATYELLSGKGPVVSAKSGAGSIVRTVKENYDWLMQVQESIILLFDNDEEGQKATELVRKELPKGKVKVMTLPKEFKDANDVLKAFKAGRTRLKQDFVNWWWNAEEYRPDGIVSWDEALQFLESEEDVPSVALPWKELQDITLGLRTGELWTFCSGSGMGKSSIIREMAYHVFKNTDWNIGVMMLEEDLRKTQTGFASIAMSRPYHVLINKEECKEKRLSLRQERNRVAREMNASGRFWLDNHFGSNAIDKILDKVYYLAKSKDCKLVIIDHISIIVSDQDNADERKAIDEIMTKVRTMVQELDIMVLLVSHLKRPDGKGHEEGGEVSLAQLRGSASIAQLSDCVIGLERNQQHPNPEIKNITGLKVLKNRFTGETGQAGYLSYSPVTGRLSAMSKEQYQALLENDED